MAYQTPKGNMYIITSASSLTDGLHNQINKYGRANLDK